VSIDTPASQRMDATRADRPAVSVVDESRWLNLRLDLLLMLAVFAVAIVPRAAWVAYNDRAPQGFNDPIFYAIFSDRLADGDGYTRPTGETFAYYPVGFPATVAGLKKAQDIVGADRSIFSIKMMNGMFGAITAVLLYLLASRIFDRRTGVVAGSLLAVFPSQVYYTGTVLSEPLFTLMWIAALTVLLWKPWDRDGMPWYQLFGAGVLLSYATMTRGIALAFPAVLLAVWLFQLRSKKRALVQALIVWAGIAVLVVPWSIRNTVAFGQLTGPSTNIGDDLCIGNYLGAQGAFTLQGKCFASDAGKTPQQVELDRNKEGVRTAVRDIASHPFRMPKLIAQKAYWLLYKDDDGIWAAESYGNDYFIPNFRREVLAFAANAVYYATGLIAMAGVLAFALAKDPRRLTVVLALLYVLAIPLVFFGDPRFHHPAIPLAVVIAAATIVRLWDRGGFSPEVSPL
jgi:4-amino-4-deoxy-L-arabinose transferase-like glycosyltransferase